MSSYALSDAVRAQELRSITGMVFWSTPEGSDIVWRWLQENFDAIAARFPRPFLAFLPSFAGGCSAERLAEAREFFAHEEHRVDGTEARMNEVADRVTDCVRLRERERPNVSRYLRSLSPPVQF